VRNATTAVASAKGDRSQGCPIPDQGCTLPQRVQMTFCSTREKSPASIRFFAAARTCSRSAAPAGPAAGIPEPEIVTRVSR